MNHRKIAFSGLKIVTLMVFQFMFVNLAFSQNWTAVKARNGHTTTGSPMLLSDGSIAISGGNFPGKKWDRLVPNRSGSYANGTWVAMADMHETRADFSSQILKDGRIYVAGGEYGTGGSNAEIYDPLTNKWTYTSDPGFGGAKISDANSEILSDGTVLQAAVGANGSRATKIYNPSKNTWSATKLTNGSHNESSWSKLPDGSILMIAIGSRNSERYIPSLGKWVVDATVPVDLYDPSGETGTSYLLPNGKLFFTGGNTGHTAIYTPSGNQSPGKWVAGPDLPNGTGQGDGGGCMMVTGNILLATSPISAGEFGQPTFFYEYDYRTNKYTKVVAPGGGNSFPAASYQGYFIATPHGKVLWAPYQTSDQYYIYAPINEGSVEASGIPTITNVTSQSCTEFTLTGTGLGGISEGSGYGDDSQSFTNFPIVRLVSGANVYYARTYNWSSRDVMQGNRQTTTRFSVVGIPTGSYNLVVSVNGFSSAAQSFTISSGCSSLATTLAGVSSEKVIDENGAVSPQPIGIHTVMIAPNPASRHQASISVQSHTAQSAQIIVRNGAGEVVSSISQRLEAGANAVKIDANDLVDGTFYITVRTDNNVTVHRLVIIN
jgi:Secretion system C-terminal sorting domain/Kelch motif